jgi:hypothetical protein
MPLSEEEWNDSAYAETWMDTISDFLEEEYPKAYSVDEILEELFDISSIDIDDAVINAIFTAYVQSMLEYLINIGNIEARVHRKNGNVTNYFRKS